MHFTEFRSVVTLIFNNFLIILYQFFTVIVSCTFMHCFKLQIINGKTRERDRFRHMLQSMLRNEKSHNEERYEEDCNDALDPNVCLQYLNYDILRIIFQYLNTTDLWSAAMVCRNWSIAANRERNIRLRFIEHYCNKEKPNFTCIKSKNQLTNELDMAIKFCHYFPGRNLMERLLNAL